MAKEISEARKSQLQAYENKLFRSSYAIRKELEESLQRAVKAAGTNSVSDLLSRLARAPEEAGAALRPVMERLGEEKNPRKATMKSLVEEIKSGELTPEEIAAAIAAAKAQKAAQQ